MRNLVNMQRNEMNNIDADKITIGRPTKLALSILLHRLKKTVVTQLNTTVKEELESTWYHIDVFDECVEYHMQVVDGNDFLNAQLLLGFFCRLQTTTAEVWHELCSFQRRELYFWRVSLGENSFCVHQTQCTTTNNATITLPQSIWAFLLFFFFKICHSHSPMYPSQRSYSINPTIVIDHCIYSTKQKIS